MATKLAKTMAKSALMLGAPQLAQGFKLQMEVSLKATYVIDNTLIHIDSLYSCDVWLWMLQKS